MKQKLVKIFHILVMIFKLERFIIFISDILNFKRWSLLPQNIYYSTDDKKIIISDGVKFQINRSDFTQWQIYANYPEMHYEAYLNVNKGNIIDIGANIGSFSLKVARHLSQSNSSFKVYSFEPYKKIFNILKKNLNLNKTFKSSIKLENTPISNKDNQKFLVKIVKNNLGANKLKQIKKNINSKNSHTNGSVSLDSYVSKNKIKNISFIKIDVEGMEIDVLEGAKKILKKDSPTIFIEINEKIYNKNGKSIIPFLKKFKSQKKIFYIENKKSRPVLEKISFIELKKLVSNKPFNFNLLVR
jgi:FkbM family methyltransferase